MNSAEPAPDAEPQGLPVDTLLAQITPRAWVTPALVGLILVGFGIELALGVDVTKPTALQLFHAGANFGPAFVDDGWWRVLSSWFLHAGPLHLLFNLWALWSVGRLTERVFGNTAFLAIYVFSGIGGSLASLVWHPMVVGVGASGAIFGVCGALLAFVTLHRGALPTAYLATQRRSMLAFVGYNIVFGLTQENVDMAAHIGGFVVGMVSGAVLGRDLGRPTAHAARRIAAAAGITLVLAGAAFATRAHVLDQPTLQADRHRQAAVELHNAGNFAAAIHEYTQALAVQQDATLFTNRALAYLASDQPELAEKDVLAALALETTPHALALLCQASFLRGGSGQALEVIATRCSAALARATDAKSKAALLFVRGTARNAQDRADEALADANASLALFPQPDTLALRADALLARNEPDKAEADCARLLAEAAPAALQLSVCTRVADARGDAVTARERVNRWIAAAPKDPWALFVRASQHQRNGRSADALGDLQRAVEIAPDLGEAWNSLAWQQVVMGQFPAARTAADRAVELEPNSAYHLGTRCFALAGLGELDKARADCVRAIELRPESLDDRGMLAFLEKRYADAKRAWEASIEADPTNAVALRPWLQKLPAQR